MPGIIELSLNYLPWAATAVAVSYATFLTLKTAKSLASDRVNKKVDLDNAKVVHTFDIEDLDKKAVFCRCWKSSKFPYCDGSHNAHNTNTGDNLGPLIIQQK